MTTANQLFRVTLTADFYQADGTPRYRDLGLSTFEGASEIAHSALAEHRPELGADQIATANGVIVLTPRVTARTVSQAENLLAIGRFGVGYDAVDVAACTAANVVVMITTGAVDRSVAEATVGWMLALTHHIRVKDRLVREGGWDTRSSYMGCELRGRTLGVVGLGGIGTALVKLLSGFDMAPVLAYDPFVDAATAERVGVRLVSLDELLRDSDFVSIHCPLNDKTRHLVGARELTLMKPTSYLLNTARGGIVDEDALYDALANHRIAGAALDCFEQEPVVQPFRFAEFDNVILAPHAIAWTDELFRDIGRTACQSMLDLARGVRPRGVVNPQVFDQAAFQQKWSRLRAKS